MKLEEIKAQVAEILSLYPKPWKLKMEGRYGQPVWWIDPLPFNVLNESPEVIKLLGFITKIPEINSALITYIEQLEKTIEINSVGRDILEANQTQIAELEAKVERLREENERLGIGHVIVKQVKKTNDENRALKAKLAAICKDAEQLTKHIVKMVKLSQKGEAYQVTENSVVAKYSSTLAEVIKEDI